MTAGSYVRDDVSERFVEVDAARLLLIADAFATDIATAPPGLLATIRDPITRHFTPEYLLQKLDFLMRYPRHLAYELVELHRLGIAAAADVEQVMTDIRLVVRRDEPDLRTDLYRKFWRGAYERLDNVESWWLSRRLVFVRAERRGDAPPQKHYFLTAGAAEVVASLRASVPHARWYADRATLLHRYFSGLSAAAIKDLQYDLPGYREAQLGAPIPDVPDDVVCDAFRRTLGQEL
jgi:hypothetical protein